MFSPNVLEMFAYLVGKGIEVSLHKREDGVFYADLHTHAKSHLHVYEEDGKLIFHMRYSKVEVDLDESTKALIYQAAGCYAYHCICGRSFGSQAWDRLCKEMDITVCYGDM